MRTATDNDVNQVFEEFWRPLLCDGDGNIDLEAVKLELYDYRIVLQEVSKVYDHITNGKFSKPNTAHEYIIDAVEEHYNGGGV